MKYKNVAKFYQENILLPGVSKKSIGVWFKIAENLKQLSV